MLNTTKSGNNKFLHWFDWATKELHIFDIVNNKRLQKTQITGLVSIAKYCRSIMTNDGGIFLIGGDDDRRMPNRKVYRIDLDSTGNIIDVTVKSPMIHGCFDFSIC